MKTTSPTLSLIGLLLVAAVVAAPLASLGGSQKERARAIHEKTLVFDAHCDTVLRILDHRADMGVRSDEGHIDIPRMTEGGLNAQVFALWVEPLYWPDRAVRRALVMADAVLSAIENHPDELELALSAADARRIFGRKKIAVFLGIEGGHAIEDDLSVLRVFHRLGVRVMTLTWNHNTNWADASGDTPRHGGLTGLGVAVVEEMNRLGMVIDLSHVSNKTFFDVLKVTNKPVIASHSNCRALCDHHRNLTDDMLRALAKNGGVVGITYYAGFVDPEASRKLQNLWNEISARLRDLRKKYFNDPARYRRESRALVAPRMKDIPEVPIDRLIDHIDHAVKKAGIDHVGLGSDFDGCSRVPVGLEDVSKLPLITEKLLQRGYGEKEIEKILGGNLLRVFEAAIDSLSSP